MLRIPLRHAVIAVLLAAALLGCEERKKQSRVGPLRDWIVGTWLRSDDRAEWTFSAEGEMQTGGRAPIVGNYSVEEPDKVLIHIAGAQALSAAVQLGLRADENKNLYINLVVQDDEMKPAGISSTVVFRKR
jgi:hypothetical protein